MRDGHSCKDLPGVSGTTGGDPASGGKTSACDQAVFGERHFRDLVENAPTGISIVQDSRVVYRNPEQQRIFGPLEQDSSPSIYDRIHPDDMDKLNGLVQSTLAGRIPHAGIELRFIHLEGQTTGDNAMRWLHCRTTLVDYNGRPALLINMMDVTKAREMERILTIQDRMTSLGHVAAGIAHEIRNPLSGINIYLDTARQILERGGDTGTLDRILEKIQSASQKIESIIKRTMDFARPSEPKFSPIEINRPVADALELSSVMLRKSGVELSRSLAQGLPLCKADPQLIEQVVLNLVTNAAEAMKDMAQGKRIMVCTSMAGGLIRVSVADSGPGVPQDIAYRIFDPFFTTKNSSTGIGLSLSQRIIHDHGGMLTVHPGGLGGAEFSFTLPVHDE
jgi:PAS domain S-box-containing protein